MPGLAVSPTVEVVIPHGRGDDPHRVAARDWVANRYRDAHGLPVTLAECPTPGWSKGAAANPAIAASRADVIVLADADSYVDDAHLARAIDHAANHGWAVPHSVVKRLSRTATATILAGGAARTLERGSYPALPGGGIVAARADTWALARGVDPRFTGWGGEDHALGLALTLLTGPANPARHGALFHLWHPPHPQCRKPSPASRDLAARYRNARRDPAAMTALINEW